MENRAVFTKGNVVVITVLAS